MSALECVNILCSNFPIVMLLAHHADTSEMYSYQTLLRCTAISHELYISWCLHDKAIVAAVICGSYFAVVQCTLMALFVLIWVVNEIMRVMLCAASGV